MNEMLDILRCQGHRLPKYARTLLGTPQMVQVIEKCGGKYYYFGIETGIIRILAQNVSFAESNDSVDLTVNIDGIPLFKSSNVQMWPILACFNHFEPFVIALYCGESKPNSVEDYLYDFLEEVDILSNHNLIFNTKRYKFNIIAFVCDAPARSFLKCIKNHNAYYACERCTIRGSWDGRVFFNSKEMFPL